MLDLNISLGKCQCDVLEVLEQFVVHSGNNLNLKLLEGKAKEIKLVLGVITIQLN